MVGAAGIDIDADDHIAYRIADQLPVGGRPVTAIRHFHNPHLGIGGRDARRATLGGFLGMVAMATAPLVFARTHGAQCRFHPSQPRARGTRSGRLPPPLAGGRILLQLALETAHQLLGLLAAGLQGCRRRNEPAPALARTRIPSSDSRSRLTSPSAHSAATLSLSSRSSRSRCATRKSDKV